METPFDECSICLDAMESQVQSLETLKCAHTFHKECFESYVCFQENEHYRSLVCPICRKDYTRNKTYCTHKTYYILTVLSTISCFVIGYNLRTFS